MGQAGPGRTPGSAETSMVIGAGVHDDRATTSPSPPGHHVTPSWRTGRAVVTIVVLVVAAMAIAAIAVRTPGTAVAELPGRAGDDVPDAPGPGVVRRWDVELGPDDAVGLVGERVVVAREPTSADAQAGSVTAYHVQSRAVMWDRALVEPSLVVVVDGDDTTTSLHAAVRPRGGVELRRLAVLAADDGHLLWQRDVSFVIGASSGHVLLATGGGCELVEVRSGRATLRAPTQRCMWLVDDEVMVSRNGQWEVYGLDGGPSRPPLPGAQPPALVGDLVAAVVADELVLFDRDGVARWRAPTGLADVDGPVRPRGLAGVGVVVSGWDDRADVVVARAFGLDGVLFDQEVASLDRVYEVEVGGQSLVVGEDWGQDLVTTTVRRRDAPDQVDATTTWPVGFPATATRQGLVVPTPSGRGIQLRTWPGLVPAWSLDLSTIVAQAGGWDAILTSGRGLVVLAGDHRTVVVFG